VQLDSGGGDDASRDSQGRLFPGVSSSSSRQDQFTETRRGDEDADLGEQRRERERETVVLGGGRMGMDDRADLGPSGESLLPFLSISRRFSYESETVR